MRQGLSGRLLATGLAATALSVLLVHGADARTWSFSGRHGGSRTVTTYHNGGGNYGRTATTTRPDGQTRTSTFNQSVNNGTITDSRSISGFNGQTRSSTVTRTPGEGATGSYTGRNGKTYTGTTTPYNNGNGNFGRTTTVTGPNGGTATRQFGQTNNGNGTFTDTRTTTLPNGQTRTSSFTRPGWGPAPAPAWRGGPCCYGSGVAAGAIAGLAVGTAVGIAASHPAPPVVVAAPPVVYAAPPIVYGPAY